MSRGNAKHVRGEIIPDDGNGEPSGAQQTVSEVSFSDRNAVLVPAD